MNRLVLLLALVLCLPLAAHADDASRRAKADELITLLHMDRMVTPITNSLMQQTVSIATDKSGGTLTPENIIALGTFQRKLLDFTDPQIGWKAIEPEFARLYAAAFTEEELDGMLAFYKSPAGTALLEKMPDVSDQASKLMQSRFTALQPQLKVMLDDFMQSLPSKPASTPAPPSTPSPSTPAPSTPAPSASGKTAPK
jgi:uncharacterized protein